MNADAPKSSPQSHARFAFRLTALAAACALLGAASAFADQLSFAPSKDAAVKAKFPDQNFGTDTTMQVSNQSGFEKHIFAQFTVSGIPAGATGITAALHLNAQTTGTGRSITAHTVSNTTWGESTVTWNSPAGAMGATLSTVSSFTSGSDAIWDVSGDVTGNGTYTIGLDGTFSGDTTFSSREGTAPPSLVVTYSTGGGGGLPAPAHIVIVVEENKDGSQITAALAPTLNSWKNSGANFTNYLGVANSGGKAHPSQPSYFQFFAGSDQGIGGSDACPPAGSQYTSNNLAHELLAAGKTFIGYGESMPANGSLTCTGTNNYFRRHCPWISWQGTGTNQIPSADSKILTPATFASMNYDTLPTLTFVIPNGNNDMHNGSITAADTWASNYLSNYITYAQNAANNSLFILIFDENLKANDANGLTDPMMAFFVGGIVKQGTYSEHINHYCLLRTIEDFYGLTHVANAASATTISDCWK